MKVEVIRDYVIMDDSGNIFSSPIPDGAPGYVHVKVLKYLNGINNGFFVEVGAGDGIIDSNTFFLEQFGWNGILIEESKDLYDKCKLNRKSSVENYKISSKNKKGSLTLTEVFRKYYLRKIDIVFLNSDIESVKGIDFDMVDIKYILISTHELKKIDKFMKEKGYENICNLSDFNTDTPNWNGIQSYLYKKQNDNMIRFDIVTEDSVDHWPHLDLNGKILLDLGCGRAVAHIDEFQQSPIFLGESGAKKVIGIDGNPEGGPLINTWNGEPSEIERLKRIVEEKGINKDGKYTFIWKMIQTPEDLKTLISDNGITAIKCDIEGYETNFYTLTKEDMNTVEVFALEYHTYDILDRFRQKFTEWGFTVYAEGKFTYVDAPQAGVLLAKK